MKLVRFFFFVLVPFSVFSMDFYYSNRAELSWEESQVSVSGAQAPQEESTHSENLLSGISLAWISTDILQETHVTMKRQVKNKESARKSREKSKEMLEAPEKIIGKSSVLWRKYQRHLKKQKATVTRKAFTTPEDVQAIQSASTEEARALRNRISAKVYRARRNMRLELAQQYASQLDNK